jgi:hypothetical protein
MLHTANACECVLTFSGDVCVSFGYAACRCYEGSVELVLFYIGGAGVCALLSGI